MGINIVSMMDDLNVKLRISKFKTSYFIVPVLTPLDKISHDNQQVNFMDYIFAELYHRPMV
jgi:hypothetical protein